MAANGYGLPKNLVHSPKSFQVHDPASDTYPIFKNQKGVSNQVAVKIWRLKYCRLKNMADFLKIRQYLVLLAAIFLSPEVIVKKSNLLVEGQQCLGVHCAFLRSTHNVIYTACFHLIT